MATRQHSGSATPSHTNSTRPLVILNLSTLTRISINVKSSSVHWTAAEVARDTFSDWIISKEKSGELIGFDIVEVDEDNVNQVAEDEFEKGLVLSAHFLIHLSGLLSDLPTETSSATNSVLLSTFNYFCSTYLHNTDIHTLAAGFPADIRSLVIKGFFVGRTKLEIAGLSDQLPIVAKGALLDLADKAGSGVELYGLFGGQGMNEVYFDELSVSFLYLVIELY